MGTFGGFSINFLKVGQVIRWQRGNFQTDLDLLATAGGERDVISLENWRKGGVSGMGSDRLGVQHRRYWLVLHR